MSTIHIKDSSELGNKKVKGRDIPIYPANMKIVATHTQKEIEDCLEKLAISISKGHTN